MGPANAGSPGKPSPGRAYQIREKQVEYGNINWILAIVCLLAGGGLGALGYHLAGNGANQRQQLRQRLAERDRELAQLREGVTDHFAQVGTLVGRLQHETRALEHRLAEDAAALGAVAPTASRGIALTPAEGPEPTETPVPEPRDYADGRGGTLSEDYGLKPSEESAAEPQPPRY